MRTTAETKNCRQCGAVLKADARGGLCPRCLVQLGIAFGTNAQQPVPAGDNLPRRFGEYELLEEIARGGMGVIFKARQVSLNRIVAVKMILAGQLATKEMVLRFRAEAESAANLHHPNIVAIYETGEIEGQHYFSMDYVAGPDLARLAREEPVNPRQAALYLEKISRAVHYAHEHGVLHRDLKPSNVLIDEHDEPRVTDFGLAKKFTVDSGLTISGQLLGSPNFMPPEQASRKRGKIGRYSDVYGLGALLYHLLTGRPPFQAATLEETLQQVFEQEPVSPRALNPSVPRDLETICLKCLDKEPARRYPTAQAVADELGRCLRHEPIHARPVSPPERLWRWCRRNPGLATLGAAVNLLLVALALGGLTVAHRQRESAERYRGLAETNRVLLYASEMKAVQQAIEEGNMRNAVTFLDRHVPMGNQDDLREFTWRYLNDLCQPYRDRPALDHGIDVIWLATARHGQWLAAGGPTDVVTVWDLKSRSQLQPAGFGTKEALFTGPVALSPNGRFLLTSGFSERHSRLKVQIWDTTTPTWDRVYQSKVAGCFCDFSPDGSLVAVPTTTNVLIIAIGTWIEVRRLTGHTKEVNCARFSNDGRKLVSGSADGTARVWRVDTGECLGQFTNHAAQVHAAAFSPDDSWIASAGSDKTVRLWSSESMQQQEVFEHNACFGALDVSRDRPMVASGGAEGTVRVWEMHTHSVRTFRGHSGLVRAVKFVLGGTKLASGSQDHTIRLWDLDEPRPKEVFDLGLDAGASPIAFSPDGMLLAMANSNATEILLVDSATGAPATAPSRVHTNRMGRITELRTRLSDEEAGQAQAIPVKNVKLDGLAFSPRDGSLVAARHFETDQETRSQIEFWDVRQGTMIRSFPGQFPFCLSRDGRRLAYLDFPEDTTILFRDLESDQVWPSAKSLPKRLVNDALAFSSDGRLLASSGYHLQLWETATGELVKRLASIDDRPAQPPLYSVTFEQTPHGELLIGSGEGPNIHVWVISDTPPPHHELRGHLGQVYSLAISPDGRTLASGDRNGLIKLWGLDWSGGRFAARELLTLRAHQDEVHILEFSPDGTLLASSSVDGTVRLWRAPK